MTNRSIELEAALRLALEALEVCEDVTADVLKAITAIKEALMSAPDGAQPEQEPVGFTIQSEIDYAKSNPKEYAGFWANKDDDDEDWIALYTTPPTQCKHCLQRSKDEL